MKNRILLACVFLGFFVQPGTAQAEELRLALVVVNQQGWKNDPHLKFAIKGDLNPLSKELKRLGFRVVQVVNQSPDKLRGVLKRLEKHLRGQKKDITFMFYYSGHADRLQLHMGPTQTQPFTYKEFLDFFQKLPAHRRFAIFDACFSGEIIRLFGSLKRYKALLKEGRLKGVRRRNALNISKLSFPNQGNERGIRIITSSLQMSWELNRYKASVFTYHLLKGIRGQADLDKDGKISVDELFDYTSREVKQVTGQKPQQLVVMRRERPYALAPAYHSRLRIGSKVTGTLQISVANFLWSHQKTTQRPLTLSLVHGKGVVRLKRAKQCWQQAIKLPKGGMASLGNQWKKAPCAKQVALRQKGYLTIPAHVTATAPLTNERNIALSLGMTSQGAASLQRFQPSVGLSFQWKWLQTELGFSHGFTGLSSFSLSRIYGQLALGLPLTFQLAQWELSAFVGGFVRGGLILQHQEQGGAINAHGVFGGLAQASIHIDRWGIRLGVSAGADITPTAGGLSWSPYWQAHSAVFWTF